MEKERVEDLEIEIGETKESIKENYKDKKVIRKESKAKLKEKLDDEGTETKEKYIIKNGNLLTYLSNIKEAKFFGKEYAGTIVEVSVNAIKTAIIFLFRFLLILANK